MWPQSTRVIYTAGRRLNCRTQTHTIATTARAIQPKARRPHVNLSAREVHGEVNDAPRAVVAKPAR